MSDNLTERKKDDSLRQLEKWTANPFDCLPAEWVPAVTYFCMSQADLIQRPLAFCSQLNIWIKDGLELEYGKRIMKRLTDPDYRCQHKWDTDLFRSFAAILVKHNRWKAEKREAEMRKESERQSQSQSPASVILQLSDAAQMPKPTRKGRTA